MIMNKCLLWSMGFTTKLFTQRFWSRYNYAMEALRNSFSKRKILIPMTMILSLCMFLFGMRTPDLSRPQNPRAFHRDILVNQIKEAKEGIENYDQFFDISHHTNLIEPQLLEFLSFLCITCVSNSFAKVFPIASRAPPVFHAWNRRLVLDCNVSDIVARRGELRFSVRCSELPACSSDPESLSWISHSC